jgi:hypothetical protein
MAVRAASPRDLSRAVRSTQLVEIISIALERFWGRIMRIAVQCSPSGDATYCQAISKSFEVRCHGGFYHIRRGPLLSDDFGYCRASCRTIAKPMPCCVD